MVRKPRSPPHCRDCVHLHRTPFRWWCCKLGRRAKKAVGECKLKHLKQEQA